MHASNQANLSRKDLFAFRIFRNPIFISNEGNTFNFSFKIYSFVLWKNFISVIPRNTSAIFAVRGNRQDVRYNISFPLKQNRSVKERLPWSYLLFLFYFTGERHIFILSKAILTSQCPRVHVCLSFITFELTRFD